MVELIKQNFIENKKIYQNVETKLRKRIETNIPINHVGSTAIPNIEYGKNIIDILIGAVNNLQFEKIKQILIEEGYVASQKSKDEIYQFFSSTASETGSGDVHIHLVIIDTERYKEFLILRDYLLSHDDEAKNYSDFKIKILELGNRDRKEYKKTKSEYVTNLLNRSKDWYKNSMSKIH